MTNFYRSGWRPAAGWSCVAGLVTNAVVIPLANIPLAALNMPLAPPASIAELLTVTLGAVGMGALRSADKRAGVDQ